MYIWLLRFLTAAVIGITALTKTPFVFLTLNTFLAYIPVELSYQILLKPTRRRKIILLPVWMLFFPNIPYLLTDFVHVKRLHVYDAPNLEGIPDVRHWALFIILALLVFTYLLIGFTLANQLIATIRPFSKNVWTRLGSWTIFSFFSALGVYVGRFPPRLHSAYFFTEPIKVFQIVFLNWSMDKLLIVGMFMVFHLWMFVLFHYTTKLLNETKK
ncbi:MAG: DUF1361 domain-containing protein [Enterococcus sp.]